MEGKYESIPMYIVSSDPDPHLTQTVANLYAELILNRSEYGEADRNFKAFQRTAELVKAVRDKGKMPITDIGFIRRVVRCAMKQVADMGRDTVYPGNLCSDLLWKVVMPQYIKDHVPGAVWPKTLPLE